MSTLPRPLGFFATTAVSMQQTCARLLRHRIRWVVLGGTLLLLAASWLLGLRADDRVNGRMLFCVLAWWLQATVLMPWATLYLGVHAAHGDLEDRTVQYLFLRPVGRVPLLLGKWLATSLLGAVLGVLGVMALYLGLAAHPDRWPDGPEFELALVFARALALGAVAYAAAAVLFSVAFRRPLLWAAFFVVGLQMLTANLPVSTALRQATITDPMRRIVLDGVEPDPRLAEQLWPAQPAEPELVGEPLTDLAWFTAVVLVAAAWIYRRTEYESRHRD